MVVRTCKNPRALLDLARPVICMRIFEKLRILSISKREIQFAVFAALPRERLISGKRAFHATGCDFFGPIMVTEFHRTIKRWSCVFVCFATRAIHLEVCYHMTCDLFLETFFRFFNTRGHVTKHIWCDNGTNLKVGSKALTHCFEGIK